MKEQQRKINEMKNWFFEINKIGELARLMNKKRERRYKLSTLSIKEYQE